MACSAFVEQKRILLPSGKFSMMFSISSAESLPTFGGTRKPSPLAVVVEIGSQIPWGFGQILGPPSVRVTFIDSQKFGPSLLYARVPAMLRNLPSDHARSGLRNTRHFRRDVLGKVSLRAVSSVAQVITSPAQSAASFPAREIRLELFESPPQIFLPASSPKLYASFCQPSMAVT